MSEPMKFWLVSGVMERGLDLTVVHTLVTADSQQWALGAGLDLAKEQNPQHGARAFKAEDITHLARDFVDANPVTVPTRTPPTASQALREDH